MADGNKNRAPSQSFSSFELPIILIAFLAVFSYFLFPVTDFDIWWQMANGRFMLENHQFITKEIFSYTAFGNPVFVTSWGFDALAYLGFKNFGIDGINIIKAMVAPAIFLITIIFLSKKKLLNLFSFTFIILALFSIREYFSLRPQTLSYLFFVLLLIGLFQYQGSKNRKNILIFLFLLQTLWVNIHASFLFGIALALAFVVPQWIKNKKPDRENINLIVAVFIASLLHVFYGFHYLTDALKSLFSTYQNNVPVREFLPPALGTFLSPLGIIVLSLLPIIYFGFKRKQFNLILIALFTLAISLKSARFLPYLILFLAIAAPFFFPEIAKKLKFKFQFSRPAANALLIIFLFILFLTAKNQSFGWGLGLQKFSYPVKAVEFIKDEKLLEISGNNIYNTYNFGGYLIWSIYPDKVFIDGRAFPYYGKIFDTYWDNFENKKSWDQTVKKYNITVALMTLPHTDGEKFYNDSSKMFPKNQWASVYYDDAGIIYVKKIDKYKEIIEKYEYKIINPQSLDLEYLKEKIKTQKDLDEVMGEMDRALKINPDSYRLHFTMSYLYDLIGDSNQAKKELLKTLKINPNLINAQKILDENYLKK